MNTLKWNTKDHGKWKSTIKIKNDTPTLYIANRAFGGLRKFSAINKHRQIFNLAFKMNKLKTKYKNVAQGKNVSLSLSIALLAIY
jgi:hypothetical protein